MDACRALILERIRRSGPMTFAEFMDLALYHPDSGYYARAAVRSGRTGDFFTSVDVGPEFGALLARQLAEMWRVVSQGSPGAPSVPDGDTADAPWFDLVEAGAGSGRLSRDILDASAETEPAFYSALRLHLIERSPAARAVHRHTLGPHAHKLVSSSADFPPSVRGVIFANELLDALPTHVVTMSAGGLREVFVDAEGNRLFERELGVSTPEIAAYLERLGIQLEPTWQVEVGLAAVRWTRGVARALRQGFLLLIDYGHEAGDLYSAARATGTRMSFRRHVSNGSEAGSQAGWLVDPGGCDITAHVDLTSVRDAAEAEGCRTLGMLDQMYFLLGLGLGDEAARDSGDPVADLRRRLALKTLMFPGGLGSTHKVLIAGKAVGSPPLRGFSFQVRLT
jgi:SAM-dependent MidA family methyltransferase